MASPDGGAFGSSLLASGPLWAVAGFLCGAIFWHMVGFWSFVGGLVAHGPSAEQRLEAALLAGTNCVTLALDRQSGATHSEPCPAMVAALPDSRRNYRGSLTIEARLRLAQPERWSITVSDTADAAEASPRKLD